MSPRARIRRNAVEKGRGQLRLAERPCQARPITLEIGSSVLQTRGCSLSTLWKIATRKSPSFFPPRYSLALQTLPSNWAISLRNDCLTTTTMGE